MVSMALHERVTIRGALLVGFGVTLGLWLLVGYRVTLQFAEAQMDAEAKNARYIQAQNLLTTVRLQVLSASVMLRDALLDPEHDGVEEHRLDILRGYDSIDELLEQYVPFVGSADERESIAQLRKEIRDFQAGSNEVLAIDSRTWPADERLLLRRFMPEREAVIRVSEQVQTLNRNAYIQQQRTLRELQGATQRQIWTVFGIAIGVSLAIAWLASSHATKLERRLVEQRAREEQIGADLHRLSARLVQVQEDEQRRIARELHDEVGQALSAVKLQLVVAQRRLERADNAAQLLADAEASADSALRTVRDMSRWLHPSALDDLGLVAAVESQVGDFRRRQGLQIEFSHGGLDGRLDSETERAIYRIVQETLTNIAKHAHATTVRVRLLAGPEQVHVVVEDNGTGFDVVDVERPGKRRGLGLLGMRERSAQLGGIVRIESQRGKGTRIEVQLPRHDAVPAPDVVPSDGMIESAMLLERSDLTGG